MNDLHKHFTAKIFRKNFTDTERLLWKGVKKKETILKGGETEDEFNSKT
jgi:hypothetical protein